MSGQEGLRSSGEATGKISSYLSKHDYSFIIQQSAKYAGLPTQNSRFATFGTDPLYKFTLINSFGKDRECLSLTEFTRAESTDLRRSLIDIHLQSPFKKDEIYDGLDHENNPGTQSVPHNSLNYESLTIDSFERVPNEKATQDICRPTISSSIKAAIFDIYQRESTVREEHKLYNITPADSIIQVSDQDSANIKSRDSISSLHSDEVIFNPDNTQFSIFDWEGKQDKCFDTEEDDSMYRSLEAFKKIKRAGIHLPPADDELSSSPEDEGPIRMSVATRLFLGDTASKQKLQNIYYKETRGMVKLPPKTLSRTVSGIGITTVMDGSSNLDWHLELPDVNSPINRKVVICEELHNGRIVESREAKTEVVPVQIISSIATCGFNCVPNLEFSDVDRESRGIIIHEPKHPLIGLLPSKVLRDFNEKQIRWISCGFEHCISVTYQGELFSWGYGASGCLGHGNANICTYPTPVATLAGEFVIYAESGGYHNAAVTESGDLWVWGRGDVHQLGVSFDLLTKDDIGHVAYRPIKTELKNVKSVACGEAHTVVLNSEGTVYAFGWAEDGQLGLYPEQLYENQMSFEIAPLRIPEKVAKVSAGGLFSVALTEGGQLYVWGNCEQGQLGIGNRDKILRLPTHLSSLSNEIIMDVVCGETHVICITTTGRLYGWGQGLAGRFKNRQDFSTGSDIVCFVPRLLKEVDIVHRFVLKGRMDNLMEELTYKLQLLKYAM